MTIPTLFAAVFAITNTHGAITYYFDEKDRNAAITASTINMSCKSYVPKITPKEEVEDRIDFDLSATDFSLQPSAPANYTPPPIIINNPPDVYVDNYEDTYIYIENENPCHYEPPRPPRGWAKYRQIGREHIDRVMERAHHRSRRRKR